MENVEVDWDLVLDEVAEEDDKFQCGICGKRVRTEIGLKRHAKIHQSRSQNQPTNAENDTTAQKHSDMTKHLPNLLKETTQKMINSNKYNKFHTFKSTLTAFSSSFGACGTETEVTKNFLVTLDNGIWGAVSTNGNLPHHGKELMWTKFHWFRTNPETIKQGVLFLQQFCPNADNGVLKQVFQAIIMQLVATVSVFLTERDQPHAEEAVEEAEAPSNLNEDEQSVLRYVAGWTVYKLSRKFAQQRTEKSSAFVNVLDSLVVDKENTQPYLTNTLKWTISQNRGGLKFVSDTCFLMFRHIHRIGIATLNVDKVASYKGGDIRSDLIQQLCKHKLINKYWISLTPELNQHWREELFSAIIKLYTVTNGHNMVEKYKQNKQIKENTLLKEQKALRKALKASKTN